MKLDDNIVNSLVDLSIRFVNNDLLLYNYDNDIKHLLYIIVPAFIIKYGMDNKNKILDTFKSVPLIRNNNDEKILQAYYTSIPSIINDSVKTNKLIVLNYYQNKSLIELIDNIVHEYNHAVNSMINEIKEDNDYIYLRTGLMYSKYNKKNLNDNSKDDSYILEEIINTKQTEELIDIINSFNNYNINNEIINNTLYNVKYSIEGKYNSNAYFIQSYLCKKLMNNNTLISVLSNLRFTGNVDEISYFFDNVTGIDNSYNQLIKILNDSVKLEEELINTKLFKNRKINKIKGLYSEAEYIVDTFNRNYHFG